MGLPPSGAVGRSIHEGWGHGSVESLLAVNAEVSHSVLRAVIASTPGAKRHDIPKPLHIPRPGEPEVKRDIPLDQLARRVKERKAEGGVDGEGR